MEDILIGFVSAITPMHLLMALLGAALGTAVGVLPGLGPTAGLALLLPLSATLDPASAIILLAAIYYGAMYGGSTTSILLNVPGEVSSVVTTFDGYQMARQGRAGPALAMAAIASFVAGTVSIVLLMLLAPVLAPLALQFGPPEFFALILVALVAVVGLSGPSWTRGLIAAAIGMFIAVIGTDPVTAVQRYTFGSVQLFSGFNFIPVVVGLFALTELAASAEHGVKSIFEGKLKHLYPSRRDWRGSWLPMLRGTGIGFAMGMVPALTPAAASFVSYDVERRVSKHPERFGKGEIAGVAAPEAANNAAVGGGMVPLLTLGIPTTPTMAVLLGGFLIQGLTPGPILFDEHPEVVWALIASMYIGNVMLLVLNLPLVGLWARLVSVNFGVIAPIILVVSVVGVYSIRGSIFDVWVMLGFGVLGWLFRKIKLPIAPLVLALVLTPILEGSLRQSLTISRGSWTIFLTEPISLVLCLIAAGLLVLTALSKLGIRRPSRSGLAQLVQSKTDDDS
jgi:putative tricarboxylic transport membrane protein